MTKDSQPDNKKAKKRKNNWQIPIIEQVQNKDFDANRQSTKGNDV